MKIPWKYCECGCHNHTATIGGVYFSEYNDLHGSYWLSTQHHAQLTGTKYGSHEEVEKRIREILTERKKELRKQARELKDI